MNTLKLLKSFYKNYIRYDLVSIVEYISYLIFLLPRVRFFNFLKSKYLKVFFGAKIGKRVVFYPGVWIFSGRNFVVGHDVDFAKGVLITTDGGVTICDRVLIGYDTKILSSNHVVPDLPGKIIYSSHVKKAVYIEEDVWIGSSCIILPGVRIGKNSVVAAGSVVTKNVPENVYIGGVPAKILKVRL